MANTRYMRTAISYYVLYAKLKTVVVDFWCLV